MQDGRESLLPFKVAQEDVKNVKGKFCQKRCEYILYIYSDKKKNQISLSMQIR